MRKSIFYSIATFFLGLILIFIGVGITKQPGGGNLDASIYNQGVIAIIFSILFLCAVIVGCTSSIIRLFNATKNK